ncbi:MAG: tRNA lysidine(34) synthetase TilS [bacterium]|nr:tRNA lysidine(34) synthetase TilS [bacterium]
MARADGMTPDELLARVAPPPSDDLLVALSGGPDSAVAAWLATKVATGRVRVVHVHHGSAASDVLAKAAAAIAEKIDCEFEVVRVEVSAGASWEGQARAVRWEAIARHVAAGESIVTGHHADDLAETTLGHLLRGAGSAGLAAMALSREGVWRPLIEISRNDVLAVGRALGLPSADDPANHDLAHTRNVIRHVLIPQLEAEFNPQLRATLGRMARALAADDNSIESTIGSVMPQRDAFGAWRLPAPFIATASAAGAARLVRRLLRAARPPYAGNADELRMVLDVVHRRAGRCEIADGWQLELEGPWLVAHQGDAAAPEPEVLPVPGSIAFGALTVTAEPAASVMVRRSSLLTAASVGPELLLRAAEPGERIEIAAGTKLVRDVMAEAEIPRRVRSAWPIAVAHGRIVAVAGVRSAPWGRGVAGRDGVVELNVEEGQF